MRHTWVTRGLVLGPVLGGLLLVASMEVRGQEGAGIVTTDGKNFYTHRAKEVIVVR